MAQVLKLSWALPDRLVAGATRDPICAPWISPGDLQPAFAEPFTSKAATAASALGARYRSEMFEESIMQRAWSAALIPLHQQIHTHVRLFTLGLL